MFFETTARDLVFGNFMSCNAEIVTSPRKIEALKGFFE